MLNQKDNSIQQLIKDLNELQRATTNYSSQFELLNRERDTLTNEFKSKIDELEVILILFRFKLKGLLITQA